MVVTVEPTGVISLDKTVSASGSGTYEDPYVIE